MFKKLSCSILALSLAFNSAPVLLNGATSPIGAVDVSAVDGEGVIVLKQLAVTTFTGPATYGHTIADIEKLLEVDEVTPAGVSIVNDPAYTVNWTVTDSSSNLVTNTDILPLDTYTFTATVANGTDAYEMSATDSTTVEITKAETITAKVPNITLNNPAIDSAAVVTALNTDYPTVTVTNEQGIEFDVDVAWTFPVDSTFVDTANETNVFTGTIADGDNHGELDITATVKVADATQEYTITFDSNGGSAVDSVQTTDGKLATLPTAPTKTGYTFKGWSTESEATTVNVIANSTPFSGATTLYAVWEAEAVTNYTITFNYNDETTANTTATTSAGKVTFPTPTYTGHTLLRWETTAGETVTENTVFDADTTVKAIWEVDLPTNVPAPTITGDVVIENSAVIEMLDKLVDENDNDIVVAETDTVKITIEAEPKTVATALTELKDFTETTLKSAIEDLGVAISENIVIPKVTATITPANGNADGSDDVSATASTATLTLKLTKPDGAGTLRLVKILGSKVSFYGEEVKTSELTTKSGTVDFDVVHEDGAAYMLVLEAAEAVTELPTITMPDDLKPELTGATLTFKAKNDNTTTYEDVIATIGEDGKLTITNEKSFYTDAVYEVSVALASTVTQPSFNYTFSNYTGGQAISYKAVSTELHFKNLTFDTTETDSTKILALLPTTVVSTTGVSATVDWEVEIPEIEQQTTATTHTFTGTLTQPAGYTLAKETITATATVVADGTETKVDTPVTLPENVTLTPSTVDSATPGSFTLTAEALQTSLNGATVYDLADWTALSEATKIEVSVEDAISTYSTDTAVADAIDNIPDFEDLTALFDLNLKLTGTGTSATLSGQTVHFGSNPLKMTINLPGYNASKHKLYVITTKDGTNFEASSALKATGTTEAVTIEIPSFSYLAMVETTSTSNPGTTTTPSTPSTSTSGNTYSSAAYHDSGSVRVNGTYITELRNVLVGELVNLNNITTVNGRDVIGWYYDEALTQEITNTSTFVITSDVIANGLFVKLSGSVSETLPDGSTNAGSGNTGSNGNTYVPSVVPSTWAKLLGKLF